MLQPTTSMGQGLLNLGLTGLNIYGRGLGSDNQFSMANFGRSFQPRKTGGRIVHRQEDKAGGGLRSLPVVKRQASGRTGIGPYGLDYMGRVQGPNIRYITPNDPSLDDLTTDRLLQAIRQKTLPGTMRRPAPLLRTGQQRKAELLANIARQKDMYKTQAQKRADKIKGIRERRDELTEKQKSALLKQLEGRDTLSGPIREAQKELFKPGVESLGFLNQAAIAANTLMAEQDKQRVDLAKEKADITMKTLELQQEANKLEDAEEIAALTKEENVEETLLKEELTAEDVAEAQDLLQYTTDFDDVAKKVGLVTKLSEINLNKAKLAKELNKKDTQVVAAFNAIRKDVREAMGVFMKTLPSGKTVIQINGKPFTEEAAAPVNEAVRKAFEAYVDAGGGSQGMKRALQVTKAYNIPSATD